MNLTRNVGRNDKNIRIAVGAVLILIGLFKSAFLGLIGLIVLGTGVISFCPIYQFLGKSTATSAETVAASDDLTERASENLEDFKQEAVETAQELKEKAEDIAEDIKEEAEEFIDDAKQKIDDVKDSMDKDKK